MSFISYIIIGFFCYLLSYIKTSRIINPIGLLCLWWFFLLGLSVKSITGLFPPSIETQFVFSVAFISALFGSLFSPKRYCKADNSLKSYRLESKVNKFTWLTIFVAGPLISIILIVAVPKIITHGYSEFIILTRGSDESHGVGHFLPSYIGQFYSFFAKPMVHAVFYCGLAILFINKRISLPLFIGIVFLVIETIAISARGFFYLLIIVFIFSYFLVLNLNAEYRANLQQINSIGVVALPVIIMLILYVSFGRTDASLKYQLLHYGINYHTYAFTLFDLSLKDPYSVINQDLTFGRASIFAAPDQIFEIISRRFDGEGYRSVSRKLLSQINEFEVVGQDLLRPSFKDGMRKANAFYSDVYPIYLDGRLPFVVFMFFLYGFVVNYLFFLLKYGSPNVIYFAMILYLFWHGYSLFSTPSFMFFHTSMTFVLFLLIRYIRLQRF